MSKIYDNIKDVKAFNEWLFNSDMYSYYLVQMIQCYEADFESRCGNDIDCLRERYNSDEGCFEFIVGPRSINDIAEIQENAENTMQYKQYRDNLRIELTDTGFKIFVKL